MAEGLEHRQEMQEQYFGIKPLMHDFDDIKEQFVKDLNGLKTKDGFYRFYDMSANEPEIVQNLFWANDVDSSNPYETPYFGKKFCYVSKLVVLDKDILNYL